MSSYDVITFLICIGYETWQWNIGYEVGWISSDSRIKQIQMKALLCVWAYFTEGQNIQGFNIDI